MTTKHYCPIPFHHLALRPNGKVYPCCFFRWEETPEDFSLDKPDLFHHPFLEQIRDDLRQDKPVAGCSGCYQSEELNGSSMRTKYLTDEGYDFSKTAPDVPQLTYLDLSLSNVCNNKCRMCNFELSTNWYADTKKLIDIGFYHDTHMPSGLIKNNDFDIFESYDFDKLTYIKLIGGEPLMEQAKFIKVLKQCNLSSLQLLITTNGTLLPNEELMSLLMECKKVSWNISIDSFGALNDFLRKGSKWEETKSNLDWYITHFPRNINVHSVISIYNINKFYELTDYIKDSYNEKLVYQSIVAVDGPSWMMPTVLPIEVKNKIKEDLLARNEIRKIHNLDVAFAALDHNGRGAAFKDFVHMDILLNKIRTEHWKDINPELWSMVQPTYDTSLAWEPTNGTTI